MPVWSRTVESLLHQIVRQRKNQNGWAKTLTPLVSNRCQIMSCPPRRDRVVGIGQPGFDVPGIRFVGERGGESQMRVRS